MWCDGSLVWRLWPPSKWRSMKATNEALPPINSIRPGTSCCGGFSAERRKEARRYWATSEETQHDTARHGTTHHHGERVRPVIALCPTGVRSGPGPIRVSGLHKPRLGIPHVSVALGPLEEDTSVIPSVHIGRDDSCRPIVICAGVSANGHGGQPGWTLLLKYSEKDGRGCVDVWTWTGGNVTHTHSPESDCQLPNADRPRRSRDACTR